MLMTALVAACGQKGALTLPNPPPVASTTPAAPLLENRYGHTATLLADGRVLVAGGFDGGAGTSADIYDPALGTWSSAASMASYHASGTATLLSSGLVLVAGGIDGGAAPVLTAELYDPVNDIWSPGGTLNESRGGPSLPLENPDNLNLGKPVEFRDDA